MNEWVDRNRFRWNAGDGGTENGENGSSQLMRDNHTDNMPKKLSKKRYPFLFIAIVCKERESLDISK